MLRRGSVLNGIVLIAAFIATGGTGATTVKPDFRHEESEIAGLRQANNEAIAARNLIGTVQILADNYAGVGGNDGIIRSKEEARAFWSKDFASVQHLNQCVRKPSKIRVGEARGILRASEIGTWKCPSQTDSGAATPQGDYFAHWSKGSGAWRVVSDNYVTLECIGPGCRRAP